MSKPSTKIANDFLDKNNFTSKQHSFFLLDNTKSATTDSKPNITISSSKQIGLASASLSLKCSLINETEQNLNTIYENALREFHIQTHKYVVN